jgi:hypothetical protein
MSASRPQPKGDRRGVEQDPIAWSERSTERGERDGDSTVTVQVDLPARTIAADLRTRNQAPSAGFQTLLEIRGRDANGGRLLPARLARL